MEIEGETVGFFHSVRAGVHRIFVDHPWFLSKVWGATGSKLYGKQSGADFVDNQRRFSLFCRAAIESLTALPFMPGEDAVIVANDWHTALVPVLLRDVYQPRGQFVNTKTALTVHNIAFQGRFWPDNYADLGLPEASRERFAFEDGWPKVFDETSPADEAGLAAAAAVTAGARFPKLNWLRAGVTACDKLLTVSPNYALEIASGPALGVELDGVVKAKGVEGIVNGMDVADWNPAVSRARCACMGEGVAQLGAGVRRRLNRWQQAAAAPAGRGLICASPRAHIFLHLSLPALTSPPSLPCPPSPLPPSQLDRFLSFKYNAATVEAGKSFAKAELQREAGLPVDPTAAVFGFIGRLEEQKGVDILLAAVALLPPGANIQTVVLGTGKEALEADVRNLANAFPGKAAGVVEFSNPMAHLITAGADFMLVPSRFEPCGLIQLHAMMYGTVPVVASTGGLVDTVKEGVTGFQMGAMDPDGLEPTDAAAVAATMARAAEVHGTPAYAAMRDACIAQDLSWAAPARKWEAVLEQLVLGEAGAAGAAAAKAAVPTPVAKLDNPAAFPDAPGPRPSEIAVAIAAAKAAAPAGAPQPTPAAVAAAAKFAPAAAAAAEPAAPPATPRAAAAIAAKRTVATAPAPLPPVAKTAAAAAKPAAGAAKPAAAAPAAAAPAASKPKA